MRQHFFHKAALFTLVLLCSGWIMVAAQDAHTQDTIAVAKPARFGIGFYAGVNNASDISPITINPGLSFMVYGQYQFNTHWQVQVGFGGMVLRGKQLSFSERRNVYDTIYQDNNAITSISYTTVPVLMAYRLGPNAKILFGLRWMWASESYGSTISGYYKPGTDTLVHQVRTLPNLPSGANYMDICGVAGLELKLAGNLSAALKVNIGAIPIFPAGLIGATPPFTGNYNNSVEIGLNYVFMPRQ